MDLKLSFDRPMIEIHNVSMNFPVQKRYKDYLLHPLKHETFLALNAIDLKIDEGDRVAFLGVNGAGKTTLLKLIGGLLYPSQGEIRVNNYDTIKNNLQARKTVGFVLNEERSFYWRLTGIQNLEFFGALDNLQGEALENKIGELLKLVGLEKDGHKTVALYSSGMKQRLAIARGLLADPKILILDEPTRTLDPKAVEQMRDLIRNQIQISMKKTLLIATHRFDEVEALCNKICIIKGGRLLYYNAIAEVLASFGSLSRAYDQIMTYN